MNEEQRYAAFGALTVGAVEAFLYDGATAEQVVQSLQEFGAMLNIPFEETI